MLVNPGSISTLIEAKDLEAATRISGLKLLVLEARADIDLEAAFSEATKQSVGGLFVSADAFFFTSRRSQIVALAARHALPAIYPWPQYAEAGGLMTYGPDLAWAYQQIASTPAAYSRAPNQPSYLFNFRRRSKW